MRAQPSNASFHAGEDDACSVIAASYGQIVIASAAAARPSGNVSTEPIDFTSSAIVFAMRFAFAGPRPVLCARASGGAMPRSAITAKTQARQLIREGGNHQTYTT